MNRNAHFKKRLFFATAFLLIFSSLFLSHPVLAADKDKTAVDVPSLEGTGMSFVSAPAAGGAGQNVEKLIVTLNETLEENRRIRLSMRDLQTAFEKLTLEKSDMTNQIRKVEQQAIQRNKDAVQQIEELNTELENSKKALTQLQNVNKENIKKRDDLEKELEGIHAEKKRLEEVLKGAVLDSERDQILARIKENDTAVESVVTKVAGTSRENVALREQLIQSHFDLGNLFYDIGRYEEAVTEYRRVLEWDPGNAWAHHNLAVIYDYHFRRFPEAVKEYREYLHLKKAGEDAREARMRLWDLEKLSSVIPDRPLLEEFEKNLKM